MRGLLRIFALLSGAVAQTQLNTSEVSIMGASYSGNGCPRGTVSTSFSSDRMIITLSFDAVHPFIGPGATRSDSAKNCVVHLQVKYPSGWQFVINGTRWHGLFTLADGIRAQLYTLFELVSRDTQVINVPTVTLNGTADVSGQLFNADLPVLDELRSGCGSDTILVHDRWSLSGTKENVYQEEWMAGDTPLIQQLELKWKECKR
ncbi:hypothetical protein B0H66DRAFT_393608 [Apodospora peruviana]|uniref:Secreted protein n=1 Tax=Apodospora peruviana TaxID=516989 RepID=A0AAE0LY99_9PEZI|nr:hypothetical protein B0H66DRAFT_393608 [Apodospora peruviana]